VSQWEDGPPPDGLRRRRADRAAAERGAGAPAPTPPRGTHRRAASPGLPPHDEEDLVIRPFLLTGGRTQPAWDGLAVESLVRSQPGVPTDRLRFEARRIVEICWQPTSVAELSAALTVPLGVVRVLVSDLVAEGMVTVVAREQLTLQMMERIRDSVRAL
jgi:Protein of unknown function (DUF742)